MDGKALYTACYDEARAEEFSCDEPDVFHLGPPGSAGNSKTYCGIRAANYGPYNPKTDTDRICTVCLLLAEL